MRRMALIVFLAVPFASGAALADNDVGCGIGTTLMEGRSGLAAHALASWTNGSTGNSVSLTFNSFGCDSSGTVTADAQLRKFSATNIDQLAYDAARGEGETLAAFGHLLGVRESQREAFASFTQAHFETLFPSAHVDSNEMIDAFYGLLREQIQG